MNSTNLEILSLMDSALEELWWNQFREQLGADREVTAYLGMASECLSQAIVAMQKRGVEPLTSYRNGAEALRQIQDLVINENKEEE